MSEAITKTLPTGSTLTISGLAQFNSLANVASTGLVADVSSTNLIAAANVSAGVYRASYFLLITTVGTGASQTEAVKFTWTDESGANSFTSATASALSLGASVGGAFTFRSTAANNIAYQTVAGGTVTTHSTDSLYIVLERIA